MSFCRGAYHENASATLSRLPPPPRLGENLAVLSERLIKLPSNYILVSTLLCHPG